MSHAYLVFIINTVLQYSQLSESILIGIWAKEVSLISNPDDISNVPGTDPKDEFILSRSGNAPHLVKLIGNRGYECGNGCMSYNPMVFTPTL
jgi:hypothetical protein